MEKMFGIESDEQYIARTTESERMSEAIKYITGILIHGNHDKDYSADEHIDRLTAKKFWDAGNAQYLKAYVDGFKAGYVRGQTEKSEEQEQKQLAKEWADIQP